MSYQNVRLLSTTSLEEEEVTKTPGNIRRIKPFITMCENQDSS